MSRQWNGDPQSPIKLRTNRQTEDQRYGQSRSRPVQSDEEDENPEAWTVEKPHSTARRYDYDSHAPRRRETTRLPQAPATRVIKHRRFDRATVVIWLCVVFIVMILGWFAFNALSNWWQGVLDDWKYGTPRTFQADQYVHLGDSPDHPDHFIALNLHGVIEVLQVNPQDSSKDAMYVLTKVDSDKVPASLSFKDMTGNGKIDIIVTIGDSNPYSVVMLNNGKTFQPTQAAH